MRKTLREVRGVRYVEVLGIKEAGTVDFLVESERNQDVRADVFRAMVSLQRPVLMFRPMDAVSYTHLDVYKRQEQGRAGRARGRTCPHHIHPL